MKQLKYILLALLGLFLVLLDVSFLSNFDAYGATIISSFLVLVVMSISSRNEDYAFFSLVLVVLFSVFSSLPIIIIAINFLALPVVLNRVIKQYFPKPNNFTALFYFIFATFIFDFILLVWSREWNAIGFLTLGYFVIINSVFGVIVNLIYNSFKKKFSLSAEVKI